MTHLTTTLQALADPSRRQLLQRLALGPATSGQLAEILTVSRPATSQHLGVLQQAGLIRSTITGRNRWNELTPGALYEIEQWIKTISDTWADAPTLEVVRPSSRRVRT
jgi:DNA-binding transcriptional ArsR family regulator